MVSILTVELAGLAALLLMVAYFSATEMSFFSLSKLQLRRLRQEHPNEGQIVGQLLEQPHRLLSMVLLGNTVVHISAAVLGYHIVETLWPAHAEALSVPAMTILILIVGEVAPKTVVSRHAEGFARWLARPTQWLLRSTQRVRWVFEAVSQALVASLERLPYFAQRKARTGLTEEEYRTLVGVSVQAGVLRKEERDMVNKILALENKQVKEVMTPRVDMQCLDDTLTREEMADACRRIQHRRVPIIHESPDTVEGILNVKEFLMDATRELDEVVEMPNFVPETMSAAKLLKSFRKQEHPVAIVVDEYGGTQGMITLEDILEEIVGEIQDEFDTSEVLVQKLAPHHYLINGKAPLDLVNEQCGLALEALDAETIAGWLIAQLGSLPKEGDHVRAGNLRVTARKVVKNRVREVLLEIDPDLIAGEGRPS